MNWSEAEFTQLKNLYANHVKVNEIAKTLGRSRRAVESKITILGLSSYDRQITRKKRPPEEMERFCSFVMKVMNMHVFGGTHG
jgi:hypothetical protein